MRSVVMICHPSSVRLVSSRVTLALKVSQAAVLPVTRIPDPAHSELVADSEY